MWEPDTNSEYLELVIEAESQSTDTWLGDSDGHFVQKEVGLLLAIKFGIDETPS